MMRCQYIELQTQSLQKFTRRLATANRSHVSIPLQCRIYKCGLYSIQISGHHDQNNKLWAGGRHDMPPSRPATEARNRSLEPGRPSRARSANTRHPAGRPHTPPADRMYSTDVRQTDVRQHHRLMPAGRGIKTKQVRICVHLLVDLPFCSDIVSWSWIAQ